MWTDNRRMVQNTWQRRISRAEELAESYNFAAEVLHFYVAIARFQKKFYEELVQPDSPAADIASDREPFQTELPSNLADRLPALLYVIEQKGPAPLRGATHVFREAPDSHSRLLTDYWEGNASATEGGVADVVARAFLQPYAVHLREKSTKRSAGPPPFLCPFCQRKPGLAVLRPLGDGGMRSLVCSFCLAEWDFRRIVCPACGEEDHKKLSVYTAEQFDHVRVDGCESCRCYLKTVDMTKTGLAEPVVDEIATIPLDLWAQNEGYSKLQTNLMQL